MQFCTVVFFLSANIVYIIEDYLRSFTPALFHLKHMFTLASLNAMIQLCCVKMGGELKVVHPTQVRSYFGLKKPAKSKEKNA